MHEYARFVSVARFAKLVGLSERMCWKLIQWRTLPVYRVGRRTLIKLLLWDGTGFWVFAKRLERGTFGWPRAVDGESKLSISNEELAALLGGFVIDPKTRRRWWRQDPLRLAR